jgi:hypothetical protein
MASANSSKSSKNTKAAKAPKATKNAKAPKAAKTPRATKAAAATPCGGRCTGNHTGAPFVPTNPGNPGNWVNPPVVSNPPAKYAVPTGLTLHTRLSGKFGTWINRRKHVHYDWELMQPVQVTAVEAAQFRVHPVSVHFLRELVKGLFAGHPYLIRASANVLLVEIALQLQEYHRQLGNIQASSCLTKTQIMHLFSVLPVARVISAGTLMRGHDHDIEALHRLLFIQHHAQAHASRAAWRGQITQATLQASAALLVTAINVVRWKRSVSSTLATAGSANITRTLVDPLNLCHPMKRILVAEDTPAARKAKIDHLTDVEPVRHCP